MKDFRALVIPGRDYSSGMWISCVKYTTTAGAHGVRVLGSSSRNWDVAAESAIQGARRMAFDQSGEPGSLTALLNATAGMATPRQKEAWDRGVETARLQRSWQRSFELR